MRGTSEENCRHKRDAMKRPALRGIYMARFFARCAIFLACIGLFVTDSAEFAVLQGRAFFRKFSVLHLLWLIWMLDMVTQIFPIGKNIALGSLKLYRAQFRPIVSRFDPQKLKAFITQTSRDAYIVFALWIALIAGIGALHRMKVLNDAMLFLISVAFYVCDLICVLFWCPFRVFIMKNRCCTTCRIFNWDHLMMFTPMVYIRGFYPWSLILMSALVFLVWEISIYLHPERFWECTNQSLQCAECTDRLCLKRAENYADIVCPEEGENA